jgi:hypothetical protein
MVVKTLNYAVGGPRQLFRETATLIYDWEYPL